MVSGVRSPAAARLWGAAWASRRTWARGSAHRPRAARSLKPPARSSRAAVPLEAVQSWPLRAASLGSVTSSLGVPGTFTGSCGVFGCFPRLGREAGREDELGSPPFWAPRKGRERGDRGGRGGRGDRAGLRGVLFPAPAVLPSDGWGEAKSKHPVPRPPSRLPFFPVLQILGSSSSGNAGRKLAREGGGGWKFLAALCLSVFGAEEVGGWVGGGVRGGGENALLAELLGGSGDNSLGSSGGNRRSRWRTRRPSCQLPAPPTAL
uniref:Uncharacterized protein n=1 Tax=Rousettus aegyptiacus TaxID=9407 RepID=A0A7J8HR59_ROUAE|nr:hypothetical protein HJG63_010955 [Rousettus aegyptiacus]